jgi:hypothetical protein
MANRLNISIMLIDQFLYNCSYFYNFPMHQYASGYVAMGDNPVSMVDPSGMWTGDVWNWIRGLFDRAQNGSQLKYGRENLSYLRGWEFANRWNVAGDGNDEWNVELYGYTRNGFSSWGGGSSGGGGVGDGGGSRGGGGVGGSHSSYVSPPEYPVTTEFRRSHSTFIPSGVKFLPQFAPSPWSGAFSHSQGITSSAVISNINVTHNILGWITSIEGVKIRYINFFDRSAFTLPGVGIFANYSCRYDLQLFMHEFGHVLQARKWGIQYYYEVVGPTSVLNYNKYNSNWWIYNRTWTEWSANLLSYIYFLKPTEWDPFLFPLSPGSSHTDTFSPDSDGPGDFLINWILK